MNDKYDCLKLENQLCFPLYAVSKEIIKHYKPFLDEIDLTYTQYIVMMVMWEDKKIRVKDLGERLYLDSGTLTPLLKKLESKGFIKRVRSLKDERNLILSLTESGEALKDKAVSIPHKMAACVNISQDESKFLYGILYKLLENTSQN